MNYREYVIFTGEAFFVPEHIQRIEIHPSESKDATYGWQVRYGNDEPIFGDRSVDGTGAAASLSKATDELLRRIHTLEAPTGLRKKNSAQKDSNVPPGISGPIPGHPRRGRKVTEYHFRINIPRLGKVSKNAAVYIGTENTLNKRYDWALAKAVDIRNKAEVAFQASVTKAKREETPMPALKNSLSKK